MGINLHAGLSHLITKHHTYRDFQNKACLMLGVQDLGFNRQSFLNAAKAVGFEVNPHLTYEDNEDVFDSYELFKMLGFGDVSAMDISDYEGAEILHDLNRPVPKELYSKFDMIYNGGTIEHVFNAPMAMENVGRMLKVGGLVIHDAPGVNWQGHGFYSFSADFFIDYYENNNYRIQQIFLAQANREGTLYRSMDLRIADEDRFVRGKVDVKSERLLLVCVAEKTGDCDDDSVPKQRYYRNVHGDAK